MDLSLKNVWGWAKNYTTPDYINKYSVVVVSKAKVLSDPWKLNQSDCCLWDSIDGLCDMPHVFLLDKDDHN